MSGLISFPMRDHLVQSARLSAERLVNRCQGSGCTVPMDIPNETYILVDMDSYLRNPMTKNVISCSSVAEKESRRRLWLLLS